MPDFDVLGSGLYGSLGSTPSSGFDVVAPNAGGRPISGLAQNGGQQQQPGAPISGLVAGALGLPTMAGADPGTAYLAQNPGQQPGGQGQQPQQMSGLMAGLLGMPQPGGQATGQQGQMQPNGGQPQNNIGSGMGGLLRSMIYNGQSQDV